MDFLERFFGCSPDGGTGVAEVFLLLGMAVAGVGLRLALKTKSRVAIGRRFLAGLSLERS